MLLQLSGSTAIEINALREVILTINASIPAGTILNIQTGAGGGPATISGDPTILLPTSGVEFAAAGILVVMQNGQSLIRGVGLGFGEAQWVSSTQLAIARKLTAGQDIRIISPLPAP